MRRRWQFSARLSAALTASLLAFPSAPARAADAGGEARVCLEEVVLEVLEGGKAVGTRFVSRSGPDKAAAIKELKGPVFTGMELRPREESGKGPGPGPGAKTVKVKALAAPRLRFYGPGGKIIKEIGLGLVRSTYKKSFLAGLFSSSSDILTRFARVSGDQRNALLWEHFNEYEYGGRSGSTGKATYYSASGKVLWEKRYPKHNICMGGVSDDGSRVFLFDWRLPDQKPPPARDPEARLTIYDRNGGERLVFPGNRAQLGGRRLTGEYESSPKAGFVALKADKYGHWDKPEKDREYDWIFIDTAERSFFICDELDLTVTAVSETGLCSLSHSSDVPAFTLDLTKKKFSPIGE